MSLSKVAPTDLIRLPPDDLMFRVSGDPRPETYLAVGKMCFSSLEEAALRVGRPLDSFQTILDFGCGCGRVLRWWPSTEQQRVHGTDIDASAIQWCVDNLPRVEFRRNAEVPPSFYQAETFDLIFSISVFSHLRQDYLDQWASELSRISAPGCILILTLHGARLLAAPMARAVHEVVPSGSKFQKTDFWKGHFPSWYGNLYFTEEGAREAFGEYFDVVEFIPGGMAGHQDVIILRADGRIPQRGMGSQPWYVRQLVAELEEREERLAAREEEQRRSTTKWENDVRDAVQEVQLRDAQLSAAHEQLLELRSKIAELERPRLRRIIGGLRKLRAKPR
jgi:SAM-dependent methyltransferase